jgi:hypothetical protein
MEKSTLSMTRHKTLASTFALAALLFNSSAKADLLYEGPIGDKWYPVSELVIPESGLELKQDTVLSVDRLILKGDIITKGHRLKINAHEINFENSSKIIGFKNPAPAQTMMPAAFISSAKQGSHSGSRSHAGGAGTNGDSGRNGFDGMDGRQDSKEIDIFSLVFNGNVIINGNGQKGAKGGKGGRGQNGGRGGTGSKGYAKARCIESDTEHRGSNGGPGGYPGEPGVGGQGGMGGNNIPVKVYSALSISPSRLNIETRNGLPGDAGDAGEWGSPGAGGAGGGSDDDTDDCSFGLKVWVEKAHASGGSPGSQRDYSAAHKNQKSKQAKGKVGRANENSITSPEKSFYQELREKQLAVYDNAYRFHYARLFQFLIQDGIRLATQSQFNRSMVGVIDQEILESMIQSDEILIEKLIYYWKSYFIDRLLQEDDLSFEKQEYLEIASEFIGLLSSLKGSNSTADQMILDWNEKLGLITDKTSMEILTLNKSCTVFLKKKKQAFAGELPFTDLFNVPVCTKAEIQNLIRDPSAPIKLVAQRSSEHVFPPQAIDLKVNLIQRTLKEGDRQPLSSNPFQIVIVNNRRYTLGDFATIRDTNTNEMTDRGLLESLNYFEEQDVTISSYPKFIKILLNGLQ